MLVIHVGSRGDTPATTHTSRVCEDEESEYKFLLNIHSYTDGRMFSPWKPASTVVSLSSNYICTSCEL